MGSPVRLRSGNLLEVAPQTAPATSAPDSLQKKTILVHAGKFQSVDGPIEFDVDRIKRVVARQNAVVESMAQGYGGVAQIPVGAFPPILEDHDEETRKVVGRLTGLLEYQEIDIPGVGSKVPAAIGTITFLGTENVARVLDGRIYHVSIGIDEATDTLSETSVVVSPAAPGAMLLAKGKSSPSSKSKGGTPMPNAKRLASLFERKSRLGQMKSEIETINRTIKSNHEVMRLKAKETKITHRLRAAVAARKMSPAELKQMVKDGDIAKLSKMPDDAADMVVKTFENREPVIDRGQKGTTEAIEGGQMAKEIGHKRLKSEIKADLMAGGSMKRLRKMEDENGVHEDKHELLSKKLEDAEKEHPEYSEPSHEEKHAELARCIADLKKHLEDGNLDEAKKAMEKLESLKSDMKHLASGLDAVGTDIKGEDYERKLSEMEEQVARLETMVAKLVDEVKLIVEEEEKEGHDLEADGGEREADNGPGEKKPPQETEGKKEE